MRNEWKGFVIKVNRAYFFGLETLTRWKFYQKPEDWPCVSLGRFLWAVMPTLILRRVGRWCEWLGHLEIRFLSFRFLTRNGEKINEVAREEERESWELYREREPIWDANRFSGFFVPEMGNWTRTEIRRRNRWEVGVILTRGEMSYEDSHRLSDSCSRFRGRGKSFRRDFQRRRKKLGRKSLLTPPWVLARRMNLVSRPFSYFDGGKSTGNSLFATTFFSLVGVKLERILSCTSLTNLR